MSATTAKTDEVAFHCKPCFQRFRALPTRIEDAPDRPWHPWAYFAQCPSCGLEVEQAAWERNLAKSCGPKTPEGKARAYKNLETGRSPEHMQRSRFNALTHGLYARTATFFPARPGLYDDCMGCEHFPGRSCLPYEGCLKRVEIFLQHHIAVKARDPQALSELLAGNQAAMQALVNSMIRAIGARGVELVTPEVAFNPDTKRMEVVRYQDEASGLTGTVNRIEANPLLRVLIDVIQKNGMTLRDMGLTQAGDDDADLIQGHLDDDQDQLSADTFRRDQSEQMERIQELIERSYERVGRDPVLIEHQGEEGDDA